jgi:hypothetical protein
MPTTILTIASAAGFAFSQQGGKVPPTYDTVYFPATAGIALVGRATFTSFTDTAYSAQVPVLEFPTQTLGAGSVQSANLILQFSPLNNFTDEQLALFVEVYPGYDGSIAEADWTPFSTGNVGSVPFAQLVTGADIVIPVPPGLLQLAGPTAFRLHSGSVWGPPGSTRQDQWVLEDWALAVGPRLEVTYTPGPVGGTCHVVAGEAAGAPVAQCPLVGAEALNIVELAVVGPGGVAAAEQRVRVALSHSAAWRNLGGTIGAVTETAVEVELDGSGEGLVGLPPQASLGPLDGAGQGEQTALMTLPSGFEAVVVIPDIPTVRLEQLLSGSSGGLGATNALCAVSFSILNEPLSLLRVRLSAAALWERGIGDTVVHDATEVLVALDENGEGTVELAPQASLVGPNGAEVWWEFKLPGQDGWVRATVPDAATADFSDLVLDPISW